MRICDIGSWVLGLGLRVWGLGFRVSGLGFSVQGLKLRVQGSGFRALGSAFTGESSGLRVCAPFGIRRASSRASCFRFLGEGLQGCLAHKKQTPLLGPPQDPRHSPTVGAWRGADSYEPGIPIGAREASTWLCRGL